MANNNFGMEINIMLKDNTIAVIVSYNPDIERLKENVSVLLDQTAEVVIFDNNSDNADKILELRNNRITVILNQTNEGLPVNYNRATLIAMQKKYEWLLILDQDTLVPNDLIDRYMNFTNYDKVAIICPAVYDENLCSSDMAGKTNSEYVEQCISSASLNRVNVINKLGGFDEEMFIDYVDYDYCKKVTENGYKILRVNDCVISHQIGNSSWVKILGRSIQAYNHKPIRKYYYFRNRVYYARKWNLTLFRNKKYYKSLCKHFVIILHEEDRMKKLRMAIKGFVDGFKM